MPWYHNAVVFRQKIRVVREPLDTKWKHIGYRYHTVFRRRQSYQIRMFSYVNLVSTIGRFPPGAAQETREI